MYDIVDVVYVINGVEYSDIDYELSAEIIRNDLGQTA